MFLYVTVLDSFEFGMDIVDALVKPFIESRSLLCYGLHCATFLFIIL